MRRVGAVIAVCLAGAVGACGGGSGASDGADAKADMISNDRPDVRRDADADAAFDGGGDAGPPADAVADAPIDATAAVDAPADAVADDGSTAATDVSGDATAPSDAASDGPKISCGFVMPSPAAAGLPNPASYDTSIAGVVTDKVTGLMWEDSLKGRTPPPGCTADSRGQLICPWRYAAAYCAGSRLQAHADWRLPSILELVSLIDFTRKEPAIDLKAFPDEPFDAVVWSGTRTPGLDNAWYAAFNQGTIGMRFIDTGFRVQCVRTGGTPAPRCAPPNARYTLDADTAVDKLTGLTWRRNDLPNSGLNWTDATAACAALGGGYRLPTINEAATLVDFSKSFYGGSVFDTVAFPHSSDWYWTSSQIVGDYPDAGLVSGVWALSAEFGRGTGDPFTRGINGIRCVK